MAWEYKYVNFPIDQSTDYRINLVGDAGWELVSWQMMQAVIEPTIVRGAASHAIPVAACIFKRPKVSGDLLECNSNQFEKKSQLCS